MLLYVGKGEVVENGNREESAPTESGGTTWHFALSFFVSNQSNQTLSAVGYLACCFVCPRHMG